MNSMNVISNTELCDRHALEMLVNYLGLAESIEILCEGLDEHCVIEDFREFVEMNLPQTDQGITRDEWGAE